MRLCLQLCLCYHRLLISLCGRERRNITHVMKYSSTSSLQKHFTNKVGDISNPVVPIMSSFHILLVERAHMLHRLLNVTCLFVRFVSHLMTVSAVNPVLGGPKIMILHAVFKILKAVMNHVYSWFI